MIANEEPKNSGLSQKPLTNGAPEERRSLIALSKFLCKSNVLQAPELTLLVEMLDAQLDIQVQCWGEHLDKRTTRLAAPSDVRRARPPPTR